MRNSRRGSTLPSGNRGLTAPVLELSEICLELLLSQIHLPVLAEAEAVKPRGRASSKVRPQVPAPVLQDVLLLRRQDSGPQNEESNRQTRLSAAPARGLRPRALPPPGLVAQTLLQSSKRSFVCSSLRARVLPLKPRKPVPPCRLSRLGDLPSSASFGDGTLSFGASSCAANITQTVASTR